MHMGSLTLTVDFEINSEMFVYSVSCFCSGLFKSHCWLMAGTQRLIGYSGKI